MTTPRPLPPGLDDALAYPLFRSVVDRRSRRVGLGMQVASEGLDYASPYRPVPLSEVEEALLCVAGTGLTGLDPDDLDPARGEGAPGPARPGPRPHRGTELFLANDDGLYMLDTSRMAPEPGGPAPSPGRPREERVERLLDAHRRARVEVRPGRAPPSGALEGGRWDADRPGTTLLIPVSDATFECIDLLFTCLSRSGRLSIVDERAGGESAGLRVAVAAGRLDGSRRTTIGDLEQRALSRLLVEQAVICQNVTLALQALGLGGCTFTGSLAQGVMGGADDPGLGFRFARGPDGTAYPVGLDGRFEAFTPPYLTDMREAVEAFMAVRWPSPEEDVPTSRREPDEAVSAALRPHEDTVELVKQYCQYVHETHGRFPLTLDPMCQRLTVQAQHVDPDFYERFSPPGALTGQHLRHFERWHPDLADRDGGPPRR